MNDEIALSSLRKSFRDTSTKSMPVAGMLFWSVVGIASLLIEPQQLAYVVLFGSGMIFPLGVMIDRMTGKKLKRSETGNPVLKLFMQSLGLVVLVWPLVIISAMEAANPDLIVLGGAILMGIIWIPFGWASDDPVGLEHAVGRAVICYATYLLAPEPYCAAAVSAAVIFAYGYAMVRMRRD